MSRNLGLQQRLHLNHLQNADYKFLRHPERLSRRTAWAICLFICGIVWTFVGLGIWAWLR